MKWLVWSIGTWFCKHEWEREECLFTTYHPDYNRTTAKTRVSATCTKCGWHRKYDKI